MVSILGEDFFLSLTSVKCIKIFMLCTCLGFLVTLTFIFLTKSCQCLLPIFLCSGQ